MSNDHIKVILPIEVTEALRKEYEALSLTDEQAEAILASATTTIIIKPGPGGANPDRSHD